MGKTCYAEIQKNIEIIPPHPFNPKETAGRAGASFILILTICLAFLVNMLPVRSGEANENIPSYELKVSFDLKRNLIKGIATITGQDNSDINVSVGSLRIISSKLNGEPFNPAIRDGVCKISMKGTLEIAYEGIFRESEGNNPLSENTGTVSGNFIDERGVYLTENWYPSVEGLVLYKLKAIVPGGFTAISEADEITTQNTEEGIEYSFHFPHPAGAISLIAGRYRELRESFNGMVIYGYFFHDDISIAQRYFAYAGKYLKMYGNLLGPYPYKRFSIAESFLPKGYSMPTCILPGKDVMRLPSVAETSFGHEILHQWFGDSVYVDYRAGDWSEGLTSYLSDYLYEERKGERWKFRKKIIVDYESYVSPGKEFPLREFTGRTGPASEAIGYGKGAMFFHMLKNLTGDEIFFSGLKEFLKERAFRKSSWDDLRAAFEKACGKDLGWFFTQWLDRKGIPSLEISNPRVVVLEGIPTVIFDVIQKGEPYKVGLALTIKTDREPVKQRIDIKGAKETFSIAVKGNPLRMTFDSRYDIMRKLSKKERPFVISRLLGDEKRLVVVPEEEGGKYTGFIKILKNEGFVSKDESEITDADMEKSSLIVFGYHGPLLQRLFGSFNGPEKGFSLVVRENPLNTSKVIAVAHSDTKDEVDLASKKISHYGNYSSVRFVKGRNVVKKTGATEQGMEISLYQPVGIVQPRKMRDLDDVINAVSGKPIIYIGERHTSYEDHKVQLRIIMSLYEKGRKFAVGMEMFQKPFQKAIDDYISGAIDEREFLQRSQYFRRWQFDYKLYKEIIDFAKAKNIPVIALNLWTEIVRKVSARGLDSLTDLERGEIPRDMDMADDDYRELLKEVFEQHKSHDKRSFENFYQSQILWDETMAHSVAGFMKKNPGYQVVVLSGVGHVMYKAGIPQRAFRLNGKEYVTIIPGIGDFDKDLADFVFLAPPVAPPLTLRLGVAARQTPEGRVKIVKVIPGSIAESAGMEPGDIMVSLDDWKIGDVYDIKIFLVDRKRGEKVKIKVLRKRFLSGYKEIELNATL